MAPSASTATLSCYPSPLRSTLNSTPSATRLAPSASRSRYHPLRAATAGATLREVCSGRVPDHVIQRAEDVGYVLPTEVQEQSLPVLLSGQDCILHAQTGSGKTLTYLLAVFSEIDVGRSSVQALVIVPTRELGIQVTKVARLLAAKTCNVMALLDGGMLKRQKSWVKESGWGWRAAPRSYRGRSSHGYDQLMLERLEYHATNRSSLVPLPSEASGSTKFFPV